MRFFLTCNFTVILASVLICAAVAVGQEAKGAPAASNSSGVWEHQLSGKISRVQGSQLQIETRDKRLVEIDAETAIKSRRTNVLSVGGLITAVGAYDSKGVFHAQTIQRAKNSPTAWPADR